MQPSSLSLASAAASCARWVRFFASSLPARAGSSSPFGELSSVLQILCLASIFWIKLTSLFRFLNGCAEPATRARSLRAPCLASMAAAWTAVSVFLGLGVFMVEGFGVLGGLNNILSALQGGAAAAPRAVRAVARLENTWAVTLLCLFVDAIFTASANSPCALRCAAAAVPAIARAAYPPARIEGEGAAAAGDGGRPKRKAVGTVLEGVRALDCTDALFSRLCELGVVAALAKYGA